jgi:hypothetical protein
LISAAASEARHRFGWRRSAAHESAGAALPGLVSVHPEVVGGFLYDRLTALFPCRLTVYRCRQVMKMRMDYSGAVSHGLIRAGIDEVIKASQTMGNHIRVGATDDKA